MHFLGKLWSSKKKINPGIVCLFSFPQLYLHTSRFEQSMSLKSQVSDSPHSTLHWKTWISAFLQPVSVFSAPEVMSLPVLWISDAYQDLFHLYTFRYIPDTLKLCYFGQLSQGSDVAQIQSCPTDLCVFWPNVELHTSMTGMCWMLWIRLLHRAVPRVLLLNYISAIRHNSCYCSKSSLAAGRALWGTSAFKFTSSCPWHRASFRKNEGSHRICPADSAPKRIPPRNFLVQTLGTVIPEGSALIQEGKHHAGVFLVGFDWRGEMVQASQGTTQNMPIFCGF